LWNANNLKAISLFSDFVYSPKEARIQQKALRAEAREQKCSSNSRSRKAGAGRSGVSSRQQSDKNLLETFSPEACCVSQTNVASGVSDTNKQTPWPLVRERSIPTERPSFVNEIYCQLLWIEGCRVVSAADPLRSLISVF
jgi:hypothetical protein